MRLFVLTVLTFAFSNAAFATSDDPFNPDSCQGPIMSGTRALEILKEKSSVNLAALDGEPSEIQGLGRRRQKLNGAVGDWYNYASGLYSLRPYLENSNGTLSLRLVFTVSNYSSINTECTLDDSKETLSCKTTNGNATVGSGKFTATFTNQCLRLTSSKSSPGDDIEWAYLLKY